MKTISKKCSLYSYLINNLNLKCLRSWSLLPSLFVWSFKLILIILKFISQGGINAQGWAGAEPTKKNSFIRLGVQNECDGKDSLNLTIVGVEESDAQCSPNSVVEILFKLVTNKARGGRDVTNLSILTASSYPDGGKLLEYEKLFITMLNWSLGI